MKHEELIEKYIQNNLSPIEVKEVKELLKNDNSFKEALSLHTDLKKVVVDDDDANFRNLITNLEQDAKHINPKRSFTKWLVAASIALLFGLSYFFLLNQKTASTNALFASYFVPYKNVVAPMVRGNTSNQQDEKTQAFLAYEKGEYNKAITLFTKLYENTKEPYYLFYKANALLKLERAQEAVPLLIEHLKTKDTLTEKTNWYLALAYLKIQDKQKAKELLKKVIANKSYKNKEAQKLMNEFE